MDYKKETALNERLHEDRTQSFSSSGMIVDASNKSAHKIEEDHDFFHILAKKSEKIVTALYMVTDYMDTDEPIRNKLRDHGVELVSDMAKISSAPSLKKEFSLPLIAGRISEIFSFMDIASSVGLISDMNHKILRGEMLSLKESLLKRQEFFRINIFEDLFTEEDVQKDIKGQSILGLDKRQIKAPNDSKEQVSLNNLSFKNSKEDRKKFTDEKRIIPRETATYPSSEKKSSGSENSSRKDIIIGLVKDKGEITIKDISCIVSDCSEKTIQRELLSLVNSSVLKKIGEKRWSRYSLSI